MCQLLLLENVTNVVSSTKLHLSPFSPLPPRANHPRPRGSVIVSASSCAVTFASADSPCECVVKLSCGSHAASPSRDRKSTRLNSSHRCISYAVFCLKKKTYPYSEV